MAVHKSTTLASAAPMIVCLAFIWPFGGGGRTVHMMAGNVTPAPQGTVQVKTGNNGNTTLDVKARALAPPSSLTPAENAYVLWIQPPDQAAQNQGRIKVDSSENAELQTRTPYKRFKVFITAEENAKAQTPMGPKVLSADVSRG
ncbi:MAG TPA: hypothetical protein VHU89_06355 [Acidobacteriaceae bacterium]|nr:hypothetical protein [Acidobacteriaceae bacterium]